MFQTRLEYECRQTFEVGFGGQRPETVVVTTNRRRLEIATSRSELVARIVFLVIGAVISAALLVGAFLTGGFVPTALIAESRLARGVTTFLGLVAVVWGWSGWLSRTTLREILKRYEKALGGWLKRFLLSEE